MVRIICRIKPPQEDNIKIVSDKTILLSKKSKDLLNHSIIKPYQFTLDKFYDYDVSTFEIFNKEINNKIEEKENFSLFIYGHSGSGKTYTLFGNDKSRGIFDLLCEKLEYDFKLEALNICYDGNYDLFDENEKKVSIYADSNNKLCYTCQKQEINEYNYEEIKEKILNSRITGTSKNNDQSSRSHLILKIFKNKKIYTIIDLAGNERKPFFKNKTNELETTFINSSLLALKECFRSYGKSYMPYRRSDLTRFLRNIIESKNNLIISTIHSGFPYFYDSIDTLNYVTSFFEKYKQKPNFYNKKILPKIDYSKKGKPQGKKKKDDRIKSPKIFFKENKELVPVFEAFSPKSIKKSPKTVSSDSDSPNQSIKNSNDLSIVDYSSFEDDSSNEDLTDIKKQIDDFDNKLNMIEILINNENDLEDDSFLEDDSNEDDFEDEYFEENKFIEEVLNKEELNDNNVDPILLKNIENKISDLIIPIVSKKVPKDDNNNLEKQKNLKVKELEFTKKIIGIINNMIYRRTVSNYGLLLEDDFELSDALIIKKNTIGTLEACIQELKKL